jgi:phenylpropionate dioxygenase-like ring-hydroxylating dioxygenase large terminal subunit
MGALLREYWTPAVRSARLTAGGAPVPVRLLGENFVAFRSPDGGVGFLGERCPHRGASLTLARNEDCALRCLYHGWKIDRSGTVVEVPSEPADRADAFATKVRVRHAPTVESGGVVWVYLGTREDPPPFPAFQFNDLPADQVRPLAAETDANWFQGVEGTVDSSHISILHKSWLPQSSGQIQQAVTDTAPRYEYEARDYGIRFAAVRNAGDGMAHVRISEFVMPGVAFIPTGDEDSVAIIATPIDDRRSRQWFIRWNSAHPLTTDTDTHFWYHDLTSTPDDFAVQARGLPAWGQDRAAMAAGHFSGFHNLILEDVAIQESQEAIVDRSQEKLGSSDVGVIQTRRLFLDAVRAHAAGGLPAGQTSGGTLDATAGVSFTIPADADWRRYVPEAVRHG